jgi:SHS2 domain-containing protein
MTEAGWEHFEVEADVGIRGWGPSRAVAVAQLTLGVFSLIAAPGSVEVRERREVRAQAEGPEALLVTWVDECLYVHEIEGFVVHEVEMTVCTDTLAHGYLHGEPLDAARHRIGTVVKGATYHRIAMTTQDGLHEARLIVDV